VQTFNPEHYAVASAARHDFAQFVRRELDTRRQFGYPPFGALVRIIVRGPSEPQARQFVERVAALLASQHQDASTAFRVVGPAPAPVARLRGNYRFHLLLQAASLSSLQAAVRQVQKDLAAPDHVQWQADVDPLDML
jgi:primosomal protein N' (replication factor Y)